jgi:hypothetical protein
VLLELELEDDDEDELLDELEELLLELVRPEEELLDDELELLDELELELEDELDEEDEPPSSGGSPQPASRESTTERARTLRIVLHLVVTKFANRDPTGWEIFLFLFGVAPKGVSFCRLPLAQPLVRVLARSLRQCCHPLLLARR